LRWIPAQYILVFEEVTVHPNAEDDPLACANADRIREVREVLEHVGYTESRILDLLGAKELPPDSPRAQLLPLWLRRTGDGQALGELVNLFLLDQRLDRSVFQRAVQPMSPEVWAELGLVRLD
jgi:hypothetical protein